MASIADLLRAFLLAQLGLEESDLSTSDLLSEWLADAVVVPAPEATGTFTLKSVDGELTWVEDV